MLTTYEQVIIYDGNDYLVVCAAVKKGVVHVDAGELELPVQEVKGVFNLTTCPDMNSCQAFICQRR